MVEGSQLTAEPLCKELRPLCEAILADLRAGISVLHTELKQEIEAIHSETSKMTISFHILRHDLEEEINTLLSHSLSLKTTVHSACSLPYDNGEILQDQE